MRFLHTPHPHVLRRRAAAVQPPKVADEHVGINGWLAIHVTAIVGTMWCAYAFTALSLYGLPAALSGGPAGFVQWASSQFIQLVLLPVIIVGQNVQSAAADKRAEQTYNDAEAILHEATELQEHMHAQDEELTRQTATLERLLEVAKR